MFDKIGLASRRVLWVLLVAWSVQSAAEETWTINHKDADLRAFVEQIAKITGKTFVIDPTLKGKITVISTEPSNKQQALDIFMTILDMHGYSAVKNGEIIQVVKLDDTKSKGAGVDDKPYFGDQEIMTRVVFVKNRNVAELVPLLRPMVAKYGHLAGVTSANALIVSDTAANISRMEALIAALDILNSEEIEVIQLKEAWVGNIVGLLERLVPEEVASASDVLSGTGKIRIVADERSNSVILKGEAGYRDRIRALIKTLDQPSTQTSSSTVIFLNNANATKMAALLTGFAGAVEQGQGEGEGSSAPSVPATILADDDLNALIIRAEPQVLSEIQGIVTSLDVPRAQVLIEAAIVEVTGNVSDLFGVQWGGVGAVGSAPVGAISQFNESGANITSIASSLVEGLPNFGNGLLLGLVDSGASFGALVQALESRSNANLLSTPSIMTLDNNEASLLVGGTVPFRTTSQQGSDGNPFETISRQDVGTTLRVTPHIQKDGFVSLDVETKTESVLPRSEDGAVDLQTSKREITTKVLVAGGQTIVLGGLIKEVVSQGVSKVPILGSLPGIGRLFRSQFEKREKINLVVFIRPTIVRDKIESISNQKFEGIWEMYLDGANAAPEFEQLFAGDAIFAD